jgi:hypothetical protein
MTFWGVSDAHRWISGDTPLFDAQYFPKPANTGVLDALRGRLRFRRGGCTFLPSRTFFQVPDMPVREGCPKCCPGTLTDSGV